MLYRTKSYLFCWSCDFFSVYYVCKHITGYVFFLDNMKERTFNLYEWVHHSSDIQCRWSQLHRRDIYIKIHHYYFKRTFFEWTGIWALKSLLSMQHAPKPRPYFVWIPYTCWLGSIITIYSYVSTGKIHVKLSNLIAYKS